MNTATLTEESKLDILVLRAQAIQIPFPNYTRVRLNRAVDKLPSSFISKK